MNVKQYLQDLSFAKDYPAIVRHAKGLLLAIKESAIHSSMLPMELETPRQEGLTIKEQLLKDADGDMSYIKEVAEHGCSGGSCNSLIYYKDTHAFYERHAEEIDELLQDYQDDTGVNLLAESKINGDLRNFLAWFAYEVTAQKVIDELESK